MAEHWHILGAGAIGCLFADALQRTGCRVTLLSRQGRLAARTGRRCRLVIEEGARRHFSVTGSAPVDQPGLVTHLLVTTKAYDVERAVDTVMPFLAENAAVVILANGLGYEKRLKQRYPGLTLYRATTTEGAHRIAVRHVRHSGRGMTVVGARDATLTPPRWFAPWRRMHLACDWSPGMDALLWRKLTINCAINPLTALHHCNNGALLEEPALQLQVAAVCSELAAVGTALGYAETSADVLERVNAVIRATARNRSSMLQDVEAGVQTEIDFITGYLLRAGNRAGVETPHNRALFEAMTAGG